MVSQRQRLARKCFREANPNLFPPKPTPPADGTKKKSKKNKKGMFNKAKKAGGAGRSKHPLRVPGMRPGERCFICKATEHVAKACPEKALWDKNKICLLCRERGHSLKNCPEKSDGNLKKFCYNCGESGHSLSKCPKPIENAGTNFASCFVCKHQGHLSKNCPENKHGIYPKAYPWVQITGRSCFETSIYLVVAVRYVVKLHIWPSIVQTKENKTSYSPGMMLSIWRKTTRKTILFWAVEMILKTISLKKKNRRLPNRKKQSNQVQNQPQAQAMTRRMPTQRQKENMLQKLYNSSVKQ